MSRYEMMAIPIEADGVVDDEEQFNEQMDRNADTLAQEIADSYEEEDYDSLMSDYEDNAEFVVKKESNLSPEQLAKIAKRKSILGRESLFSFMRQR